MKFKRLCYTDSVKGPKELENGDANVAAHNGVLIVRAPKHMTISAPYVVEWAE